MDCHHRISHALPLIWENPHRLPAEQALASLELSLEDVKAADDRLRRWAPLLSRLFPESGDGVIESPLIEIPRFAASAGIEGPLMAKQDCSLPIAGSIKARGGIYEVLHHAETLALSQGALHSGDDALAMASPELKQFFGDYRLAVGSTGNLGLSIGIVGAALGFSTTVHMSSDAKEWKKELLRSKGVTVVEYQQDYDQAVAQGRKACQGDPRAYFVDDENSRHLFLGYAVAALRLRDQLQALDRLPTLQNPLRVYLPCGVGGAPGGITFGLKCLFGDAVQCWLVEPTDCPCMLLGMMAGHSQVSATQWGLGKGTEADGLAVASPSKFALAYCRALAQGVITVQDRDLFCSMAALYDLEAIKAEPSAAAALVAWQAQGLPGPAIAWLTGGIFLPQDLYRAMLERGRSTANL